MEDWKLPADLPRAVAMVKRGYSTGAVAMQFGATGSDAYYAARKALGDTLTGRCPYCGSVCMGTGDCNCQEE